MNTNATATLTDLQTLFARQRSAFAGQSFPDLGQRLQWLQRLSDLLHENQSALVDAISQDFGSRSPIETVVGEIYMVQSSIAHTRKHLKSWMSPRRVSTALTFLPGSCRIVPQPLGVVGIISPWNYPLQLALVPAVAALAAGCRVLLKPSELTPLFSTLLAQSVGARFAPEEFAVLVGEAELARAFAQLPFDHLFFTGSTAVGRLVSQAAAANLTPVTLELGGKSPALLDADCDLTDAAEKIAIGKLFNAGQTCIAPDYVLLPEAQVEPFAQAYAAAVARFYPTLEGNPDYTSIINARHLARLHHLIDDAVAGGAELRNLRPTGEAIDPASRKLPPALLLGVHDQMAVMREEIFGPVLPLRPYRDLDQAIAYVNAHPRPLALYWFGRNPQRSQRVLLETLSGGVTLNDTLLHIAQENLPFGGVGDSGSGAYHGDLGFKRFSHEKAVFSQARWSGTKLLRPPYGPRTQRIIDLMQRLV